MNTEERVAYNKKYHQENKERARQRLAKIRAADPVAFRAEQTARMKAWRKKNPEKLAAQQQRYRNREHGRRKTNELASKLAKTPKGRARHKRAQAKRRTQGKIEATLTAAQWTDILALYNHRCVYCGRSDVKLTQDHYLPLSKGGHHTKDNIVPACTSCNCKKRVRHPHRLF